MEEDLNIKILKTKLKDVLLFKPNIFEDFRGTYTEIFNKEKYEQIIQEQLGKKVKFLTGNEFLSRQNVLRGLHGDDRTWKLFNCSKGTVYIVVVNCDKNSANFGEWEAFTLSDRNKHQLLVPPKHGNGTLAIGGDVVIHYKQSEYYRGAENQFTYKFNDSKFNIWWPIKNPILSQRDEK